jgi:hypothetical protein
MPMHRRARQIALIAALSVSTAPLAFAQNQEAPDDYPAGEGRDTTFYACTPCHGFKIVAQQGQTRQQWEDTLNWMTQKHGMPPIDGEMRKVVLDYLETAFPPRTAPGGWKNPFSGQ